MTAKFFVSTDSKGFEWPPDNSHETTAAIEICRKIWRAFNSIPKLYVLIANLHQPSADLIVLTGHGIGVVELKHYFGKITMGSDSSWYAGKVRMAAGSENKNFNNPHEQVQSYAEEIRKKLQNLSGNSWLPGRKADWPTFKFQTAVCFSHPEAFIDPFKNYIRQNKSLNLKPWEEFSLLTLDDVPDWAAAIRFEVNKGYQAGFEPILLTPQAIINIARDLLKAKEWLEITNLMPTGDPYGYLTLLENGEQIQMIPLDHDKVVIGRNPQVCSIIIPEKYREVSRKHCQIIRTAEGVYLEDLKGTNGTYLDGKKVLREKLVRAVHRIVIGGIPGSEKTYEMEFKIRDQSEPLIPSTIQKNFD